MADIFTIEITSRASIPVSFNQGWVQRVEVLWYLHFVFICLNFWKRAVFLEGNFKQFQSVWSAYHWWDWWPSWARFHPQLRNPWFRPGQRQAVGSRVWTVWTQALTSTFRCLNKNSKFNLVTYFLHTTSKIVWLTIGQPQSYDTAKSSLWSVVCGVLAWLIARKYDCLWQLLLFF